MARIQINNLCKEFGAFTAVKSSSFTVEDGEFFMLLGPSGCGKTTTLRMMAGLELPTSGEIYIDDIDVSMKRASQRDIAFVFQMFALYPHMNVSKNIMYPLISQGMSKADAVKKVREVAQILDIESLLNKSVSGLSGGDRQRVALGRAIVREPKAFFMDEPLGALDAQFREYMAKELRTLHDKIGATTVYVTHDQLEAMQMGDKIIVMNHGVIDQFGEPQNIYNWPATKFVADFIGSPSMNFLDFNGVVNVGSTHIELNGQTINIPTSLENAQGLLCLGVRPEHVLFSSTSKYRGQVIEIEYMGTTQIITLRTSNGDIKARIQSKILVNLGESIGLEFDSRNLTIFQNETGLAVKSEANKAVLNRG